MGSIVIMDVAESVTRTAVVLDLAASSSDATATLFIFDLALL